MKTREEPKSELETIFLVFSVLCYAPKVESLVNVSYSRTEAEKYVNRARDRYKHHELRDSSYLEIREKKV